MVKFPSMKLFLLSTYVWFVSQTARFFEPRGFLLSIIMIPQITEISLFRPVLSYRYIFVHAYEHPVATLNCTLTMYLDDNRLWLGSRTRSSRQLHVTKAPVKTTVTGNKSLIRSSLSVIEIQFFKPSKLSKRAAYSRLMTTS